MQTMAYLLGDSAGWVILLTVVLGIVYYYATRNFDFFLKRGIPYMKPLPIFGNSLRSLLSKEHASVYQVQDYNLYRNARFYGKFNFTTPVLVVRDPDLVETILIKDFTHFYNRGIKVDVKLDRLTQHLVNLRDQQWKSLRNKLTPVFTSGKLKLMHDTLTNCCGSLVSILDSYSKNNQPFDAREIMANFTTEVIGHCAFGLEMNALQNPDSEFRKMGKEFFRPSPIKLIRLLLRQSCPWLLSLFHWKQVPENVEQFFIDAIKETMEARQKGNIQVHDFLNLLIDLRKKDQPMIDAYERGEIEKPQNELLMDDQLMTSNAMVFFLAGFETTATTLSSCLFELTQNLDVQEKLRREVTDVMNQHGGLTADALKNMSYLDCVISETLRKHPPVISLPRECTKEWRIPDTDITLPVGSMIQVPTYSLHHDPQYYPEPQRFIPERFAEENKHMLTKGTFLPFGDGPRICIGFRFARTEMKIALATMISRCKFTLNEKTKLPVVFNPSALFLVPKDGYWIDVQKI